MSQVPRLPDELLIKIFASIPTSYDHSQCIGDTYHSVHQTKPIKGSFKSVSLACKRFNALIKRVILRHIPPDAVCFLRTVPEARVYIIGSYSLLEQLNTERPKLGPYRCWSLMHLDLTRTNFINNLDSHVLDAVCSLELFDCRLSLPGLHHIITRLKNLKCLTILGCTNETVGQPGSKDDEPAPLDATVETRGGHSPPAFIHLCIDQFLDDELFSCLANYPAADVFVRNRYNTSQLISFSLFQRYLRAHKNVTKSVSLKGDLYSFEQQQELAKDVLLRHVQFEFVDRD